MKMHLPDLFRFEIGVQSTNDLTNELVKRRQNFEKLSRTVTMVKEGGKIAQHLDLIAGLPEEDYNSFRNTFNEVFAMRPEELQLGFLNYCVEPAYASKRNNTATHSSTKRLMRFSRIMSYHLTISYVLNRPKTSLKSIGTTTVPLEQSNISSQKSLKRLLTSSNSSERIGNPADGLESDISWKISSPACMISLRKMAEPTCRSHTVS